MVLDHNTFNSYYHLTKFRHWLLNWAYRCLWKLEQTFGTIGSQAGEVDRIKIGSDGSVFDLSMLDEPKFGKVINYHIFIISNKQSQFLIEIYNLHRSFRAMFHMLVATFGLVVPVDTTLQDLADLEGPFGLFLLLGRI